MTVQILLAVEESLRSSISEALCSEGFAVLHVVRGDEIEPAIVRQGPQAIVLDWLLPGISGIQVCRDLRVKLDARHLGIVLLSEGLHPDERIAGLSAGADECLSKPFLEKELIIRLNSLIRRISPSLVDDVIRVGDLTLDRSAHKVFRQKREVRLGPTEFRLLDFLMQNPGRVYTRMELRNSVWGEDATVDERAVDLHIGRLRKGISLGKADAVIRTVRGTGYGLSEL